MIEMVTVMQAGLKRAEDRKVSANMKDDTRNKKNEVNDRKTKSLSQDDHQKNKEIAFVMLEVTDSNSCKEAKTMASISFNL